MWIEEVTLENVKCFQSQTIKLGEKESAHKWVTFLGENGTGKTTFIRMMAGLLKSDEVSVRGEGCSEVNPGHAKRNCSRTRRNRSLV